MKGDFTRDTFNVANHFSRVLMQQGRVQLDADWNEQQAILLHHLRTLAQDIFGPYGGPDGAELGFVISIDDGKTDIKISPGHYYVHGILCENEGKLVPSGKVDPISYFEQPDYPMTAGEKRNSDWKLGNWLAYLDVWERHISCHEKDAIREVALGGPDTATRAQVVWQVKLAMKPNGSDKPCTDGLPSIRPDAKARLRARVTPDTSSNDPCITPPHFRFRGGNQLYRIEIHDGGHGDTTTFKWSRDNGSVAARWLRNEDDAIVVSDARGFQSGKWVELTDDWCELRGEPGEMRQIASLDGDKLVLDHLPAWSNDRMNPRVRQWDQFGTEELDLQGGVLPMKRKTEAAENWLKIEQGLEIQFDFLTGAELYSGDYWLIPARAATGEIEWPVETGEDQTDQPKPQPPHGVQHYYAPLASIKDGVPDTTCLCRVTFTNSCTST